MDTETKALLLDRFRAYLDQVPNLSDEESDNLRQTDLFSLFSELAALKNEVRLESRQLKTALDEFRTVFATLQSSHGQLSDAMERLRTAHQEQCRSLLRPLLLELLELYDRLEAGLLVLRNNRPAQKHWFRQRQTPFIEAVGAGQEISLRRLEQLLNAQQVHALEVIGKPLDPHTMRAAEVDQRKDLANGIVTEELRKGFSWDGETLRLAEVKVNKQPD